MIQQADFTGAWSSKLGEQGWQLFSGALDPRRPHGIQWYFGRAFQWERTSTKSEAQWEGKAKV